MGKTTTRHRGWTLASDKLPERGERVLVAYRRYEWSNSSHKYRKLKRLGVRPATYWLKGHMGLQFCLPDGDVVQEPVAWMPFPEPPSDATSDSTTSTR
jgi:hypothetical protein